MAAIITTQVAAKDWIGPRPMSIPSIVAIERDCWTMTAQAMPAAARTTTVAIIGLASSGLAARAFLSARHAGQNPAGLACLTNPSVKRSLPSISPDTRRDDEPT